MSVSNNIIPSGRNIRTTGIQAKKIEPDFDVPISIEQTQIINLIYNIENLIDTAQIERAAGGCIQIEYPVTDISEFDYLSLIESQFADRNTANFDDESIDKTVCQLIPYYLDLEGLQLPSGEKDAARIKTLILKQVRGIKSDEKIVNHLKNKSYLSDLFEVNAELIDVKPPSYSDVRDRYEMDRQPVQSAIRRLRHMLYRNGVLLDTLPDDGYDLGQAIPMGKNVSDLLRFQGLINWSNLLLDQLTQGISFGRSGAKHTVRDVIAAVANISLEKSTEKRQNLARLQYTDDIITIGQIRNIIYKNISNKNFLTSKQRLEIIATNLHKNLFRFASEELGFFSKPLDIAIDPTWYSLEESMDHEKINGAMGNIQLEGNSGFSYATGVSFTPMSRFSLGVSLVTDKSAYPNIYRRMLLFLQEYTDIGWILADRQFDQPEMIELARTNTGDTWIIRLRNNHNLIDNEEYKQLQKDGKAKLSIGDIEVNAYWKDISDSDFSWVFQDQDDDKIILLSGKPLTETNISYLSRIYPKRWSAETHIRQLKHAFASEIPGKYALDYLFFLNMSSIFYNIYKIINQSLSPVYGLPLQPRYYEVLSAIVQSTFQSRCCSK